ncbi:VOC family protein [Sphingobium sp.]|uniref:VOC family protein n=1 Tax=Sphingobium sp. TaxID=1912891 RepID=UPI0028BEBFEE|nr:VOC family protein [Sphingobium sp.]
MTQLGYVEFETAHENAWLDLARTIGFQLVGQSDGRHGLRMDAERNARVFLRRGSVERLSAMGWEASGPDSYCELVQRLENAGAQPRERPDLLAFRSVQAVAEFRDPDGNTGEVYWGPSNTLRTQFRSPEHVQFVAGAQGVGHVTMAVRDMKASREFYTEVLGLKLTEVADVGSLVVTFMRAGTRHHSLAIAESKRREAATDHLMIEVATLDDLGSIRDRLQDRGHRLSRDLGRHATDGVISMYIETPGDFTLELGWGSYVLDDATWEHERFNRTQWSWGHRRPGDLLAAFVEEEEKSA